MTWRAAAVVGFVLLGSIPALAPGDDTGGPVCLPGEAFESDAVRIWFQGLKGHLHITDKASGGTYSYRTLGVAERDAQGAEVRTMALARAFPHSSTCEVTDDGVFLTLAITITGAVREVAGAEVGEATVTLAYRFNQTALGAKFDLDVQGWPWAPGSADHLLAYEFAVASGSLVLEPAENGIGVRDPGSGEAVGYVDWAPNATARYADGTEAEAVVDGSTEGTDHARTARLEFTAVQGGHTELLMDPWLGVGDYVIVAGLLVGLAPVQQALPAGLRDLLR